MKEPRSTATIKALASLAELSADQLEGGKSIDEVVATLRKAAAAVRLAVDPETQLDTDKKPELNLVEDLTPMDLSFEDQQDEEIKKANEKPAAEEHEEEAVLNAG